MNRPFLSVDPGTGVLGRRSAPRLRLCAPAKLVSICDTRDCLLLDVSRSGALLRLRRPLPIGSYGYLRVGPIEAFSVTVRGDERIGDEPVNAVQFDAPMSREQVAELRAYVREYLQIERRSQLSAACDWVHGIGR